jgi:hypothetical protein
MKVISETCHAHLIQYLHLYWCENQLPHINTNVDIELSVHDKFLT